jgi:hypothetical protein
MIHYTSFLGFSISIPQKERKDLDISQSDSDHLRRHTWKHLWMILRLSLIWDNVVITHVSAANEEKE